MKRILILLCFPVHIMTGCTKDEDKDPEVGTKLTEIVPQDFLNEALKMGFTYRRQSSRHCRRLSVGTMAA
jgi:hypothetical protein